MYELKLRKVDGGTGMVLPNEIIEQLQCKAGDAMRLSLDDGMLQIERSSPNKSPMDTAIIEALMREEDA